MSDREARILGAGEKITVGEKEYTLRPVVAKHLCDLERDSLKFYKRQYLTTFSDNSDLLPKEKGIALLEEEMRGMASKGLNDIPQKTAYDTSKVPVTDELKKWIKDKYTELPTEKDDVEDKEEKENNSIRGLLLDSLYQEAITSKQIKKLTGQAPIQGRVRYDQWWITGCTEGRISFILSSVQIDHKEITKEDIKKWSFVKIIEAAGIVEEITSADMGNM